jgi:hypothetical protein
MMDIDDPRNPNNPNRRMDFPDSPAVREGEAGMMWPIMVVIAALVAGLLFFGTTRTDQPTTQVGQNVERPATPNTTPSTPKTTPQ